MSPRSLGMSDEIARYIDAHSKPEHPVLARLRAETAALGEISRMQIGRAQGQFLALLVQLIGARRVLEIGCFTGYSSTAMGLVLPAGGKVLTCDVSEQYTAFARRAWSDAGIADRVELRLAPALETLEALEAGRDRFDLAFLDADKANYDAYWERCVRLVRPGGAIVIDNVLWSGRVLDPSVDDPDTRAIRALNGKIRDDVRVASAMLGAFDGLTLARVLPAPAGGGGGA